MIVPENAGLEDIGQWGPRRFPGYGTPIPTRAYGVPARPFGRPRYQPPPVPQQPLPPAISSKRRRKLARRAEAAQAAQQASQEESEDSEMEGIF